MKRPVTRFLGLGMVGMGLLMLSASGGAGCSDAGGQGDEVERAAVRHVLIDADTVAALAPGESVRVDLGAARVIYHFRFSRALDWSRIDLMAPHQASALMTRVIAEMQQTLFDPLDAPDKRFEVTSDPSTFEELSPGELDELKREGFLVRRAGAHGTPKVEPQTVNNCQPITVYLPVTVVIDGQTFTFYCEHVFDPCAPGDAGGSGCADGEREGFVDESAWPSIAGCSGAWSIPGLHTENPGVAPACPGLPTYDTVTPACGRKAGDDAADPSGAGCNVADLCAEGWHVCTGDADVRASSSTGCTGAARTTDPPLFFATRQSTNGCGVCANGSSTASYCNSTTCGGGCLQTASISNDFFGCGNFGSPMTCGPLNRFSHNLCSGLGGSWSCDDPSTADDSGLCEAYTALKSNSAYGGVLCCRDAP